MALLGQRVYAVGGNQVYLALKKEEYIRPLAIGSNWTVLRIGLLFAVSGPAGSMYGVDFGFGVCNSSLLGPQGLFSYNCPNWYGRTFNATTGSTVTYTAGTSPYYQTVGTYRAYRQGQSRGVWGAAGTAANLATTNGTPQRRSMHVIEISKGAAGATSGWGTTMSVAQTALDWTFDNLLEITEQYNQAPVVGTTGASTAITADSAAGTGAQNDTAGPLDSISIAWSPVDAALEIYGIAVYRVY